MGRIEPNHSEQLPGAHLCRFLSLHAPVERQRLLNVLIPVAPFVCARKLLVIVRDSLFLQVRVKIPVRLNEEIFGAAVDPNRGRTAVRGAPVMQALRRGAMQPRRERGVGIGRRRARARESRCQLARRLEAVPRIDRRRLLDHLP